MGRIRNTMRPRTLLHAWAITLATHLGSTSSNRIGNCSKGDDSMEFLLTKVISSQQSLPWAALFGTSTSRCVRTTMCPHTLLCAGAVNCATHMWSVCSNQIGNCSKTEDSMALLLTEVLSAQLPAAPPTDMQLHAACARRCAGTCYFALAPSIVRHICGLCAAIRLEIAQKLTILWRCC